MRQYGATGRASYVNNGEIMLFCSVVAHVNEIRK